MLSRRRYIAVVVGVVLLLATCLSAEILTPCEKVDDRVADKQSCTRFHICREDPDSEGDFLSDIAVCPPMMVFDMVNTTCVDIKQGYLQDPAGCNSFYGCRLPSQSSEGYLRTRYRCPGGLRFDPELRFCTHKTSVPDTKCNSHIAVQAILGQQGSDQQQQNATTSDGGSTSATPLSQPASTDAPALDDPAATDPPPTEATAVETTTTTTTPSTVERFNGTTSNGTVFRVVTPGERPAKPLTDIDKIAQVIKGQLLTRKKQEEAHTKLK